MELERGGTLKPSHRRCSSYNNQRHPLQGGERLAGEEAGVTKDGINRSSPEVDAAGREAEV